MASTKKNAKNKNIRLSNELLGMILLAGSVYFFWIIFLTPNQPVIDLKDSLGFVGAFFYRTMDSLAGDGKVFIPMALAYWGTVLMTKKMTPTTTQVIGLVLLGVCILSFCHGDYIFEKNNLELGWNGLGGGVVGGLFTFIVHKAFGQIGTFVILWLLVVIALVLITQGHLLEYLKEGKDKLVDGVVSSWNWLKGFILVEQSEEAPAKDKKKRLKKSKTSVHEEVIEKPLIINNLQEIQREIITKKVIEDVELSERVDTVEIDTPQEIEVNEQFEITKMNQKNYRCPSLDLLEENIGAGCSITQDEINEKVVLLQKTLNDFGVKGQISEVSCGPAITRYEFQPAAGVKVSKIVNLSDDIALSLAAAGVRIEAPIPGKAAVGIEVPNKETGMVTLKELIESKVFQSSKSKLTVALGKDISGQPIVADLSKMPHLLIAGSTGSGKSVCMNTLITSVLFKASPDEVKFLMIDPKMVELGNYNGIPHLISPVVTDAKKAAAALRWAVHEMERRYELFANNNTKDITRFNQMAQEKLLSAVIEEDKLGIEVLPYIVVLIDELADLMMVAPADVEDAICRLAQMARAAGIHLVVATQRPSVDVITGIIKANIPSRIAFAVSSQIDSRTILDMGGAEKLLGKGDMLFYPTGLPKPIRVQGVYASDKEIDRIVEATKQHGAPVYDSSIDSISVETDTKTESQDDLDSLIPEAVKLFIENGQASISLLQRRFRIGYNRAARIIDQMEQQGLIGAYEGSKPRQVKITMDEYYKLYP